MKLNEKFYPKLLFEMTTQYKLGVNSAPDDTIRNYNITDDIFQFNAKFGYKARSNWYYSTNVAFKTQLFNNYASNSRDLRAAFMSPGRAQYRYRYDVFAQHQEGELRASINPLSYNLKTCTNDRMNETAFGIKEGRSSVSQIGSNAELTFKARLTWNITYTSRLFLFTNYEYLQGDWQNTLAFDINKFCRPNFTGTYATTLRPTAWRAPTGIVSSVKRYLPSASAINSPLYMMISRICRRRCVLPLLLPVLLTAAFFPARAGEPARGVRSLGGCVATSRSQGLR